MEKLAYTLKTRYDMHLSIARGFYRCSIIEKKFIANFLNAQNFTDWGRTGFPALAKVRSAISEIPRRVLYPNAETAANPQPQQKAKTTDRLWWDVN